MRLPLCPLFLLGGSALAAQTVSMPAVTVFSPDVANQSPAASYAMPVSALRYEPLVDIEARNQAEGQADVTIRGDIFENTGVKVGALSLFDPQTGHYLEALPIAPMMLSAPTILTGADHAEATMNSTVGAIDYTWKPINVQNILTVGAGNDGLQEGEVYQSYVNGGLGVDADLAHSEGNGTRDFGDFRFDRANARLQYISGNTQTDFFAGYQTDFTGWPNLYTPFDSDETDSTQTVLLMANTKVTTGKDQYVELGAFWRRNKDDYAFDRFAPLGTLHPYQHTTWEEGAAIDGRQSLGIAFLNYDAEATYDGLKSTSLIYGPYHRRDLEKLSLVPEEWFPASDGAIVVKVGGTMDRSNRAGEAYSPIAEVAFKWTRGFLHKVYASYSQTTEMPSYTALDSSPTSGLFLGNPNLGRQYSRNTEAGAELSVGSWQVKGALFYRRDDDLVDWTYEDGVFGRTANPVNITTEGFEVTARRSWSYVELVLGYTFLTKDSDYLGAPVTASFYALNYARDRLTAAVTVHLTSTWDFRSDNQVRYQAADELRDGSSRAYIGSLGLLYHPQYLKGWEASLHLDNWSGSSFEEIPSVPAPGRQFSLQVSHRL